MARESTLAELIPASPPGSSPLEAVPDGEEAAIAAIVETISKRVRAAAGSASAIRDAHPKMHGCVAAKLQVLENLPQELRQGLFEDIRSYDCWVRFSNGSGTLQPDKTGDGRGMAIKVMDVPGSRSTTQDFIMINNPVFFVRNAEDYVAFSAVTNPLRFFVSSFNPLRWRFHELFAAIGITLRKVSNPLDCQYWSMTPYLFGECACKYSCRPLGKPSPFVGRTNPDFLHDNLVEALANDDAIFEFCVQLRPDDAAMPVEDPTVRWDETVSPFVAVAHLTIPKQVFDTAERIEFGENLSFTPWHGLDAHRPLGGINRVRRAVYEAISVLRHRLNSKPRVEPAAEH